MIPIRKLDITAESVKFLHQKFRMFLGVFSDELPADIVDFTLWIGTMPAVVALGDDNDAPAGVVFFTDLTPGMSASAHILVWDKEVGTYPELLEAVRMALAAIVRAYNLMRITCLIPADNTKTRVFASHIGFTKEGEIRNAVRKNGVPSNAYIYGLLAEELGELLTPKESVVK